jgi:hypothetical protein
MTRRWIAPLLAGALALTLAACPAVSVAKVPAPKSAPAGAAASAPAAGTTTVTGIIKGAPAGKTYTVVSGKRTTSVDASGARIRSGGKFASASALAPGSFIRATGSMQGLTLAAKSIDIVRPAGGKRKKK